MSLIQPLVQTPVASSTDQSLSDVVQPIPGAVFLDTAPAPTGPAASKIVDPIFGDPVFYENIAQTYELSASGAVAVTGSASLEKRLYLTASGSTVTGGSASLEITKYISTDADITVTGSASLVQNLLVTATAAASVTGSAAIGVLYYLSADGTVAVTGAADIRRALELSASGSIAITGTADLRHMHGLVGTGYVAITGSAGIVQRLTVIAAGYSLIAGSATIQRIVNYYPMRVRDPATQTWVLARLRVKTRYDQPFVYVTAKARKPAKPDEWYWFAGASRPGVSA